MLWILRLIASTGLLGLVSQWPTSPEAAVALALGVCVVGAAVALGFASVRAIRELSDSSTSRSGVPGHALPLPR